MSLAISYESDPDLTVGERIRKAREDADLKQEELAQIVGVSRPQVSKWERNKVVPDIEQAKTIATVTAKSFGWLCGVEARSRCSALRPELTVISGQNHSPLGQQTLPIGRPRLTVVE